MEQLENLTEERV